MRKAKADQPIDGGIAAKLGIGIDASIREYVDRMEECMRAAQTAADDLKEVEAQAREIEMPAGTIRAMKKVAKLRLKGQISAAREQLRDLRAVASAVQEDLFDLDDDG